MGTSPLELNRLAIAMGKIIKLLSDLEKRINHVKNYEEEKESFMIIAYLCRKGIIDRMKENTWITETTPITIPLGLIKARKETVESGLEETLIKLLDLTQKYVPDYFDIVDDILAKGSSYYEFERILPNSIEI